MPTKQKLKSYKSNNKNNDLPERNVSAEIAIQIGAGGILAYAAVTLLMSFIVLAFNDTGSPLNGPISLAILLFSINLLIQGILVFRESRRVDHYRERIAAITLLMLPVLLYIGRTMLVILSQLFTETQRSALYSTDSNVLIYGAVALSVVGSAWLWVYLASKDKLIWIRQTSSRRSQSNTKPKQQLKRTIKLGYIFLLAPAALFIFQILFSVFVGLLGNDGAIFIPIFFIVRIALEFLWLPSIIIGIVLLRKQR